MMRGFGIFTGHKNYKKQVVKDLFPTQRLAIANVRKIKQETNIILPLYVRRVGLFSKKRQGQTKK
jgi:hypothetical protein